MQESSSFFGVGYRFYYWEFFKNKNNKPKGIEGKYVNHSGYEAHELYVKQNHSSFKEEIMTYSHFRIGIIAAKNKIMKKAKYYIDTEMARSTTASEFNINYFVYRF